MTTAKDTDLDYCSPLFGKISVKFIYNSYLLLLLKYSSLFIKVIYIKLNCLI